MRSTSGVLGGSVGVGRKSPDGLRDDISEGTGEAIGGGDGDAPGPNGGVVDAEVLFVLSCGCANWPGEGVGRGKRSGRGSDP